MRTAKSSMWKWCAGAALAAGLGVAIPSAQADVYLGLDGGLEGTATIDNSQTNPATAGKWTKNNTAQTIAEETTLVRSGSKSIRLYNSSTTARRVWTPLVSFGSKTTGVTLQYYRLITNSASCQTNQIGVLRATESLQGTYDKPASINTWEKKTYSPSSATFSSIAGVIMHRAVTAGAGDMYVDDLCIYDGSVDNIAPSIAGALTVATNSATALDLTWGASADVDGGGYLVVRYAASPAATDDPNANGIYATNSVVTGSANGTVVYQGPGLSFTDSGLTTDQTYHYKVYAYDKAYNYAAETEGSGTPAEESVSAPSVTTVAASDIAATAATANGDVTSDGGDTVTERGVCYKTSAGVAISDNKTAAVAGGTGEFSVDLSSLSVNQVYYFKAYAQNSVDTTLAANELSFITLANVPAAPTVDNPTSTSLDIAVNENGNPAATEFAIQRTSDDQYLQADGSWAAAEAWQTQSAWGTITATGLASETEYFFQVKARNGGNVETAFGSTASGTTLAAPTGIWINPLSAGAPMGTYYLGDTLGDWNVNFEIGQESWNDARVGIGTSAEGTDYNWGTANWYENGEGSNKRVRRNLSGTQFTAAGSYYVICQARANSGDAYTSKSGGGWGNSSAYPPADLASAYFTVNELSAPSSVAAAQDSTHSATRADLSWSRWNDKNVLITVATAAPSGAPSQGTAYGASDTFGNQTVVAGSQSGPGLEVTGLVPGQTYHFTFYSENNSYYSTGETAAPIAMAMPKARNTSGGSPEAPSTIFLGDSGLTFGFDSWGTIEANYGAARLWLRYNNSDLTGGTASDWTGYVSDDNKTRTSGLFNQTGTWYWGMQMDYGAEYGTAFWYKAGGADWADLSSSGSGASLVVTVSAINDPASPAATRSVTAPLSEIDLTWSQNAQGHDVMVVRKLAADSWTEPTQGTAYAAGNSLGAGTVVYAGALTAITATGLDDDTTYDFKFYSVNNDYYSAGVTAQASTAKCEPDAPTGLDATEDYTSFTASWTAVTGATGYRLDVSTEEEFGTPIYATDLFISEYIEGSSNEKYIEIYNGTGASVDLSGYALMLYANGSLTPTASNTLSGTLANGSVAIYRNSSATNLIGSTSSSVNYNGDDAVALLKKSTASYVDIFGRIGEDPGTAWTSGSFSTLDKTLVRKSTVTGGVTGNPGSGFPTLATEWNQYSISDETHLNAHAFAPGTTPSFVSGYENLAVAGTSQPVVGLAEGATYYFRVRAEGVGGCPSVNSATASATTLEHVRPMLSQTDVNVREGGEGRFFIRLNKDPAGTVYVNVSRSAGDASLSIQAGAIRIFSSANWSTWQTVTLAQADDVNADGETATFQVAMAGVENQSVEATALDDDIAENMALATGGSEIAASYANSRPEQLIDGITTSSTNYGYAICTSVPPGTITLDLKVLSTVSRVRLLTWDWVRLDHRYKIEYSANGTSWTTLVDSSATDRHGWDDWPVANVAMRYLKFTGTSSTQDRDALSVAELEVYGTRDLSNLPKPELLKTTVNVREGGEGRFFIRLDKAPEGPVVVSVERSAGDAGITIQGGATRTFKATTWSTWQAVTLVDANDANDVGETATFRISVPGRVDQFVTATALDDDIGSNLALASAGSTISGSRASRTAQLIDGVHVVSTNYGYTVWTNVPAGTMTLDMKQAMIIGRIRLLNWDWVYRAQRYTIQASEDGANWTTVADASAEDHVGWDDWTLADPTARYLRFTGLTNTANECALVSELEVYGAAAPLPPVEMSTTAVNVREAGEGRFFVRLSEAPTGNVVITVSRLSGSSDITIQSGATRSFTALNWSTWQAVTLAEVADENPDNETATFQVSAPGFEDGFVAATALDDDIGENLALASGGATISGVKASRMSQLIDGIHASSVNYGYTIWTNVPAGTITLDMGDQMTVSRVRLLNWDWVYRVHRYTIESSTDGASWSVLADASATDRAGWDDWDAADQTIRYLRFTGLTNSANAYVLVSELEVYGTRPPARRSLSASASAESDPVSVVTSDDVAPVYESGWAAVDGDEATAWVGQQAGGGNIVVEYGPTLELSGLAVDLAEDSLTDVQYLYSLDAQNWQPLPEDLEANPVSLNFLWLLFPGDGTEAVPQVIEIRPNP